MNEETNKQEWREKFDDWFFGTDRSSSLSVENELIRTYAVKKYIQYLLATQKAEFKAVLQGLKMSRLHPRENGHIYAELIRAINFKINNAIEKYE